MKRHSSLYLALLGAFIANAGCVEPEASIGEAASELSVTSWSAPVEVAEADLGGAVATVGSDTIMVRSECCFDTDQFRDLAWLKRTATGWTGSTVIPNQTSASLVSVAGFNGYVYMVRNAATGLWLSRFNPKTSTWSTGTQLPYRASGVPAIVAFQGQLRFVGTLAQTSQMWTATMSTDEVFSTLTPIPGHFTVHRPTAAVFNNRLFFAHAEPSTGNVLYGSFDGTTWSPERYIFAGPNGAKIRADEPVLAAVNGFLHLVFRGNDALAVRWTYFDRCVWVPAISIGTLQTESGYSLVQGGPGLVLSTTPHFSPKISVSEFTAPPAPPTLPTCGVIDP